MYEFDEERWDEQPPETGNLGHLAEGWMIELSRPDRERRFASIPRFLQIGTGQWCTAEYATLFPERSTAIVYAQEFGLDLTVAVRIVRHRF
ncbi:MAG: hypothetical protein ACR2NZ_12455 [Rubripirellula sp.]